MPSLNCIGSKESGRENLASPNDQRAEQSVLPPFSGTLSADKELKLSNENFKQTIDVYLNDKVVTAISQLTATPAFHIPYGLAQFASKAYKEYEKLKLSHESFKQTFDDFLKDKNITPLSPFTATPALPTPYVLAQFASKAYTDYKRRETDAQYETRLALPDGWKLLTTASNTGRKNGYFGAAYWHPEHQQVVIAHRGTALTNLGALWTDVQGVLLNKYVRQMESASTFAHHVAEVLRQVDKEKGIHFQVFFTGHSLGGWLAQITTFTTKYLKTEGTTFLKCDNVPQNYHPHTVVFDSPGCKNMLSEMADTLDVRYEGRSINLEHLDITSYLSAPNRINTCNAHEGTLYRVFTDLSDMPWWKKYSALYTFPAHSMDRIVQVFDPESGQVLKDENGQFKLQVVIDWPISTGLSGGKEYKRFFKWAKHLNNYNPDKKTATFKPKGYHPIRYQTKDYNECVTSISIFSQEERQFLEDYRRLCQLPEFFKPKEMFTAIGNKQVQKQAEEILQGFEIDNERIRCTDASALQALITYVKRLLQLFPEIRENTNCALSPHQIRNNVYQIGTKRYLEKLHQSPLDFKPDALRLRDFLNSEEQKLLHLRMVDGDAWTGLIKVYQVLQKTPSVTDYLSEGHYTVLTLQNLLLVNPMVNLNTLMESTTTPHLLMMACETDQLSDDETKIFEGLFKTLEQKQSVKFILTTQSGDATVTFLQDIAKETLSNGLVARNEQLTWSDLTPSSQELLLENAVNFQGSEIALNQLITPNSPVTNLLYLADLLGRNHIKIGEEPVAHSKCDSYDERYYIERAFHRKVIIKQDVLNDNIKQKFPDLLASTEQEFKQLCQQDQTSNVHWLDRDKSGKLVWQQSQGSLEKLRKYIDTHSSHTYTADDLDKLLEQAQKHRVMLISDTAGMGKSTVLTHLSKQIKQKFPVKWVVRIDLNDHTDALKALQVEQIGKEKAIEFVSEKLLGLEPGLEMELFKQCCEQKQKVNIVIMLDGFDEISPFYKETVIALLQALRQTAVEQLWVTTRPHLRQELEDELQQLSYTLEPFSEENQVEYLKKCWSLNKWFTETDSKEKEEKKVKLEIYAKHLIKKLAQSISDKDKEFTGIPLQCRMLAEAFDEEVKTFCQSAESVPQLPFKLDLLGLYGTFIDKKYGIIQKERLEVCESKVFAIEQKERDLQTMKQDHQLLALKMLFTEKQVTLLHNNNQCTSSDERLARSGIVQVSDDGKLHFIHRTFAEYYVADYFVNQLTKESNTSQQVQDLILQKIFLEEYYRVIRVFIDGLLSSFKPTQEVLKQYGNRMSDLSRDAVQILHQSAREGNAHIVGFLLDSVQAGEHTDIVYELLLAQYKDGHTAWHLAAMGGHIEVLETIWKCAKEKVTREELRNKFLLAKDNDGQTAFHVAAVRGNTEVLEEIWKLAKDELTTEELTEKLLLAKDNDGQTAFQVAAVGCNKEVLEEIWKLAKDELTTEELIENLLFAKDNDERTVWHDAAEMGHTEVLGVLWEFSKKQLTPEDLNNKLLLAKDEKKRTAWHLAAWWGNTDSLGKLWEWAKEELTTEELNSRFLLATDDRGQTAWHVAIARGEPGILQKIWECAEEELNPEQLCNELLLGQFDSETTNWHVAAEQGNVGVLQLLWEWAKEKQTTDDLTEKLLLAKDHKQQTALHVAVEHDKPKVLEKLWELAKEERTTAQLNKKLLLATDKFGVTAWQSAAIRDQIHLLMQLWEFAKEALTTHELKNELFLAKHSMGRTVWHDAAETNNTEVLEILWRWAEEELTPEKLTNKLLLVKDDKGKNAWHVAAMMDKTESLEKLWQWAKEKLTPEELTNNFLLAKDDRKKTAWHLAAEWGNTESLEKIWEWAKAELSTEELNNELLLAKDDREQTAFDVATQRKHNEVLEMLQEWAEQELASDEQNNILL